MSVKTKSARSSSKIDKLLKVLGEQRRMLVAAESDETLIDQYGALIRFLRAANVEELGWIFSEHPPSYKSAASEELEISEAELANMPRDEVERIISDESTPRKYLERIAIYRFQVPRGSMRRFSNREMLVGKLSTLLQNEQAHSAIEAVARAQGKNAESARKQK